MTNSFLLELDRVVEYLNILASVKAGNYDRLRTYQDGDYQFLVKLARRVFLVATRKVQPVAFSRFVMHCTDVRDHVVVTRMESHWCSLHADL